VQANREILRFVQDGKNMQYLMRSVVMFSVSALVLLLASTRVVADQADDEPSSVRGAADCVFVEEPEIDCHEETNAGSPAACSLTAVVRNRGDTSALYTHVICVTRHRETGELAQLTWRRVSFGALGTQDEKRVEVPYEYPGPRREDYRNDFSVSWKNRTYPHVRAEEVSIGEETIIINRGKHDNNNHSTTEHVGVARNDPKISVRILGFIVNGGSEAGFAPRLQARIEDENGKIVDTLFARSPILPLDPGEKLPFVVNIPTLDERLLDNISLEFAGTEGE
jgi:hypothetical protein